MERKLCIRTFEEFIKLNTYFLTPITLYEYLLRRSISFSTLENSKIVSKEFLLQIKSCKSAKELEKLLRSNPLWLDVLIRLTIASYESLGRLLLLIDKKYKEGKIKNPYFKDLIRFCLKGKRKGKIQLPNSSQAIKAQWQVCKNLIAFLVANAFFGNLSNFLRKNIEEYDELWIYLLKEVHLRFETPMVGFKHLLQNSHLEDESIIKFLQELYDILSKGEKKALEGYGYEDILKEYLLNNGIKAERIFSDSKKEKESENLCRNWDIYIPSKEHPKIVIECMYNVTTSSKQTDKRKVILECIPELEEQNVRLFVLMDGAGWIARSNDAREILKNEKVCVFTFHKRSLENLKDVLSILL